MCSSSTTTRSPGRIASKSCTTSCTPVRRQPMMAVNPDLQRIVDALLSRQRFVLSSHARPDGDSIGSQLAMGYALREMGKAFDVINADPAPGPLMQFPGVPEIRIAPAVKDDFHAAIVMEWGDLRGTGGR